MNRLPLILIMLFLFTIVKSQEKIINYTKDNGLTSNYIQRYKVRSNGEVWLGANNGINIFNGDQWTQKRKIKHPKSGKEKSIVSVSYILEDKNSMIWIGCGNGVITYDEGNWNLLEKAWKGSPPTRFFMKDSKGNFWVCLQEYKSSSSSVTSGLTKGQVFMFDGNKWINFTNTAGGVRYQQMTESKSFFTSLVEDKNGHIWIGNYNGAFKYDGSKWEVIRKKNKKIPDNEVTFIKKDKEENIWIGTDNGLARLVEDEWIIYDQGDGFPGRSVYFLWQDSKKNYWAFSRSRTPYNIYKGLCLFTDGKWVHQTDPNLVNYINSIADFGNGIVWASGKDGVSVFDGNQWKLFSMADGIQEGYYKGLFKDYKNNIWAYSKNSVIKYDSVQWSFYTKETSEGDEWKIRFLKEDSKGNIWVGTNDIGVFKFDRTEWTHYNESSGLIDDKVKFLFEDKEGNVWIIAKKGVTVFNYGK